MLKMRRVAVIAAMFVAGCMAVPMHAGAQGSPPASPEEPDLAYEVLSEATNEPMVMDIAADGRVIWGERDGTINVLTPQGLRVTAAEIHPSGNLCEQCTFEQDSPPERTGIGGLEEGGLHGLLLHRNFARNNLVYVYRSVAGTRKEVAPGLFWGEFHLSTFVLDPQSNQIDPSSEKVILKVPAEWDHCCHYGGDLDYLPDGTITLATGDDVPASSSDGYGPRDTSEPWLNGELTSANPADKRGKILRFNEDGSVPNGRKRGVRANPFIGMEGYNPYISDSPKNVYVGKYAGKPGDGWIRFDPYVYAMGFKQPWRVAVHPQTGTLYVSDVGPDAGTDDPERGPRGFEEVNRVPFGGGVHHGWPRCIGPNWAYTNVDWSTLKTSGKLDCTAKAAIARPIGASKPTVRGMTGATLYYSSGTCDGTENAATTYDCDKWPIVGSGGKTSEPVAFYPASTKGELRLPKRYNNRLLMMEWSRRFILSIGSDAKTGKLNLKNDDMWLVAPPKYSVNPGVSNPQGIVSIQQGQFMSPVDGKVGPDGAFYFLEYGLTYFTGENGRLSRIKCAGCMPSNASMNYGLDRTANLAHAGTAPVGSNVPPWAIVIPALGITAVGIMRRRRLVV